MFAQRVLFSFIAAAPLILMPSGGQAQATDKPPVIEALEDQGVIFKQEFEAGDGVRAFAGIVGDSPVAVYVLADGNAIAGTRLNAKGEPIDQATLQNLVAKPISDQAWAELESATWVADGKADAPRVIYTFSDANCPYCHQFWEAARPWVDAGKVQLRHLLVGVIKEDSPAKAAAILGSPDPSAALQENEIQYDQGGIRPAKIVPDDVQRILDDNQMLMLSMGFRGTPGIVVRDDEGLIEKHSGMPQGDALIEILGPR
ncbi:thiol:disulfide interchange protein DsbG [Allopusillimonas ginsengisoli]|uniref:thiol:disulfide interchange protein DsbG n=1 Tax=Allopusillimonas ginsengisoli TaxID=453575 RepID=UPI0010220E15|nr:thiol:disulfide interchange protein DsbG [Allopusillimonas ginsengisoli]TEA78771.1 thiol:disulfide interchange protein DsbG [Allopusillimonas ginsengisoli]